MTFLENGQVLTSEPDVWSYLVRTRHLTETDLTAIFEYYHNGEGIDPGDLQNLYAYIERAYAGYQRTGNRSLFGPINSLEMRLRGIIPVGGNQTEYGEKQSDWRVEFRLPYFF